MENPFKFGSIVEGDYFTDRVQEVEYIKRYIESPNHLVLISPRRFGKSSVVKKALSESGRQSITLNLQHTLSVNALAAALLKELFKIRPMEKLRHFLHISVLFQLYPLILYQELLMFPFSQILTALLHWKM